MCHFLGSVVLIAVADEVLYMPHHGVQYSYLPKSCAWLGKLLFAKLAQGDMCVLVALEPSQRHLC